MKTNLLSSTPVRRGLYAVGVALVLAVTACGGSQGSSGTSGGSGHSMSRAAQQAQTPATVADQRLKADGYTALHLPLFGKGDVGVRFSKPHYEAVLYYTGKDQSLVQGAVSKAKQQLKADGTTGVTITVSSTTSGTLVVVTADNHKDAEAAAKAVIDGLKG